MSSARDPRLRDPTNVDELLDILGELAKDSGAAMQAADTAGLPLDQIGQYAELRRTWLSIVSLADRLGRFDEVIRVIRNRNRGFAAGDDLEAWMNRTGIADIGNLAVEIRHLLQKVMATDVSELLTPTAALHSALRELADRLPLPHTLKHVFGGLPNPQLAVEKARASTRNALTAVASLEYQASDAPGFLIEPPLSADRRDEASRRMANYGIVDYVLRQRAVVDQAVSTLLDQLRVMFPHAFDGVTRSLVDGQPM